MSVAFVRESIMRQDPEGYQFGVVTAEPETGGCILFLGTLDPRKNLGVLLDAYEQLLAREPTTPPLVLASASPRRRDLLAGRGAVRRTAVRRGCTRRVAPLRLGRW